MDKIQQIAISRREATIEKINILGIDHCKGLPLIGDYKICKSENQICKRFIASLFFSMLACDYFQNRKYYETEGKELTEIAVKEFQLKRYLFPNEIQLLTESDKHNAVKISWTIECCYALAWVLGFVPTDEFEAPSNPNASYNLFRFIQPFHKFDNFKASCKMRQPSKIMDMLDLYYNYHWACVDHRIRPETKCGDLNEEVVMERRKALEWLICRYRDWDDISLDT